MLFSFSQQNVHAPVIHDLQFLVSPVQSNGLHAGTTTLTVYHQEEEENLKQECLLAF